MATDSAILQKQPSETHTAKPSAPSSFKAPTPKR